MLTAVKSGFSRFYTYYGRKVGLYRSPHRNSIDGHRWGTIGDLCLMYTLEKKPFFGFLRPEESYLLSAHDLTPPQKKRKAA